MAVTLIRNPADRGQVAVAVMGPFVMTAPFLVSLGIVGEIALWLGVWLFVCRHNYILHNHVHCPFTANKHLNRMIGAMLGFCTGMTVGNWKITHVHGHHVEHKSQSLPGRRTIRYLRVDENNRHSILIGIAHAVKTAPLQWLLPVCEMIRGSFGASPTRRRFYRFYLGEFLLVYGAMGVLAYLNPVKAALYFGIMYALVYLISRYVDYITHVASQGSSRYSFANVCLHPSYNKAFWNFGFHVAHHVRPTAHWSALPALHRDLQLDPEPQPVVVRSNAMALFGPPAFRWHRVRDGVARRAVGGEIDDPLVRGDGERC